jgi:DNA-binding XRE family transcriptional regulator
MDEAKRRKLHAQDWRVGDAKEFLGLSDEEVQYIELKIALSRGVRETRHARGMTQSEVAEAIGSSQSRVAKMEAGDPTVSIDLLVKTLIGLGVSREELAEVIGSDELAAA